jgi:general secretion pathway protein A
VIVQLNLLGLGEHAFLAQLAESLGQFPCRGETLHSLWRAITDRLHQNRCQQLQTLLLLDDADEAMPEVLEQIVRLVQHQASGPSALTVILSAATHRLARLGPRLLGLIELRTDIHAWEEEDTTQFIHDALQRAGREEPVFEEFALHRIHELSAGIPRRASQLADLALLVGAAQGQTTIDEATVETVSQELGVHSEQLLSR